MATQESAPLDPSLTSPQDGSMAEGAPDHQQQAIDPLNFDEGMAVASDRSRVILGLDGPRLQQENERLRADNEQLRRQIDIDPLTGLRTKEALKRDIEQRISLGQAFGLIFADMDGFKLVNDTIGHEEGDRLLGDFGDHVRKAFKRTTDFVAHEKLINPDGALPQSKVPARYGGDEFAYVIDLAGIHGAHRAATPEAEMEREVAYFEKVVAAFVALQPEAVQQLNFNVSVGRATWSPSTTNTSEEKPSETSIKQQVSAVLKQADAVMYKAKRERKEARMIENGTGPGQSFS